MKGQLPPDRRERLDHLRARAEALLEQSPRTAWEPPNAPGPCATRAALAASTQLADELAHLLEELRIYQAELDLQNDELRVAHDRSEAAVARWRQLFDFTPLPALVVDARGAIEHANPRAQALLGPLSMPTSFDLRLTQALARPTRAQLLKALRDRSETRPLVLPRVHLLRGEATLTVDLHVLGLPLDFHSDHHSLVQLVDRTEEVALEQERTFFSVMLDSSDNLVYATDTEGRVVLANRALLQLLGRQREEVVGHRREDFLPLRDAVLHVQADQQVREQEEPRTLEETLHLDDGARSYLTRRFPLRDAQRRIWGVGAISTDITELREQQALARLSETVFTMASEAIFVTDAETRIERVNPAFIQQTGFSEDAVCGLRAQVFKSSAQDEMAYQRMWQRAEREGRWAGELINRRADGRDYPVWSSLSAIRDAHGQVIRFVAVQTDLSALHAAQTEVQRLALYDSLTGLPNRALLEDRLRGQIQTAQRHEQSFALVFTDLDRFKEVNDTMGHGTGDELLRIIADRLREAVRSEDTVARIGGDEFVLLLPGAGPDAAHQVATKLLETLQQPLSLGTLSDYRPTASAGVALYPMHGSTSDELLRSADTAMYRAKQAGRNRVTLFDAQMALDTVSAFAIQQDLARGLLHGELRLHYQAQIDLASGRLVGAEALVRWQRPGHGLVPPMEFLGVAERTGLLPEIDRWVLDEAVRQVGAWRRAGWWPAGARVAVNQTALDLRSPDLLVRLQAALSAHAVPGEALEIEITEGALVDHTDLMVDRLQSLCAMGITLAIDDFGTDYSSLAYLRRLPVQVIKIDRSFVREMLVREDDRLLVETIITMAHQLGHVLVAEGVEEESQRVQLLARGCERGQGYLFGRPVAPEVFERQQLDADSR